MSIESDSETDLDIAEEVERVSVDDEMEQSYIDYAMSVIVGRALPDARDGLKPVQRRILYAMHEEGVTPHSGHRKSSSIVGDTMGNYHPHGDSSIYDALARMAQDFSLRYPLVDGQGNFGSIDDDPPAAMRYTEARMAPIAQELLDDIQKETVSFDSNYDDRLEEPDVLPAGFPNLLVNGASGIAVGMSTKIPPHNLGEVIDGTVHLLENPDSDTKDLMEHIPGPDFPTGANIVGREGIYDAYDTGQGRLRIRSEYHIEEDGSRDKIVVTEIPFQQKKSKLIEKIAESVKEGRIDGISDIRDESDSGGIRIAIQLKRGASTQVVENQLVSNFLEKTFSINLLAIVDGQPRILTLKDALNEFIAHRKNIVRKRSQYELGERQDRAHILEGRLIALDNVDKMVDLIRDEASRSEAVESLTNEFDLDQPQAEHIVRMQLGSLTSMEWEEVEEEYEQVQEDIEYYKNILNSEERLKEVIKDELLSIKESYADARRTKIVENDDMSSVTNADLIPEKEVLITLSEDGRIKYTPIDDYRTQHRGGKGIIGMELSDSDSVKLSQVSSTHDRVMFVTDDGNIYERKGFRLPETGRSARGELARNVLQLDEGESITAIEPISPEAEGDLLFLTESGKVKRTSLEEYDNIFETGIGGIDLSEDDTVVDFIHVQSGNDILATREDGRAIRFALDDISQTGRTTRGVRGLTLGEDVSTVNLTQVTGDEDVLTVAENGYGKRTDADEYRTQNRGGKGVTTIKTGSRNGNLVTSETVSENDEVVITTKTGKVLRTAANEISKTGRATKGVNLMETKGAEIQSVSIMTPSEEN